MSELVDPSDIEHIIGAARDPLLHIGRAVSSDQVMYIMHSSACKAEVEDLRTCPYSRLLDMGLDMDYWRDWQDRPVALGLGTQSLIPLPQ